MGLLKKIKDFNILQNALEFTLTLKDKDSKLYCKNCKSFLPFFRLVLKAKSVDNGTYFLFKCKKCKYVNSIRKEVVK